MPPRLHLGCGTQKLDGWVNVDRQLLGKWVDVVADLAVDPPFASADYIFAEHFIEHLELDRCFSLLRWCRTVLSEQGVVRLTTPNLDWVWATSYQSRWTLSSPTSAVIDVNAWAHDEAAASDCVRLNHAFRAWGHRFLYNYSFLETALLGAGFAEVTRCVYGESADPELRCLERHERYQDTEHLPHLLIVEARGRGTVAPGASVRQAVEDYRRDLAIR